MPNPSMIDQMMSMNGLDLISAADSKDEVNYRPHSLLSFYLSPLSVEILWPSSTSHSPTSNPSPVPLLFHLQCWSVPFYRIRCSKYFFEELYVEICRFAAFAEIGTWEQVEILTRASLTGTFVDSISNYLTVWDWIWRLRFAIELRMEVEEGKREKGGRKERIRD